MSQKWTIRREKVKVLDFIFTIIYTIMYTIITGLLFLMILAIPPMVINFMKEGDRKWAIIEMNR